MYLLALVRASGAELFSVHLASEDNVASKATGTAEGIGMQSPTTLCNRKGDILNDVEVLNVARSSAAPLMAWRMYVNLSMSVQDYRTSCTLAPTSFHCCAVAEVCHISAER